ncbi:MAG: magnesium transporter [Nitriliruptorales bacterium]|nr:magnesium transporter [Nitriliruptorales bacterium]
MTKEGRRLPRPVPAPVMRLLRRLGLPVTEVARYWTHERVALARGLVALVVAAIADLLAGIVLGGFEEDIAELPGLLVLIPAAIAMRGATFGALGARLGTAILTGQFEPSASRGGYLWRQFEAVGVLTLVTSLEAALAAAIFGRAAGLDMVPLWDLVVVSVVGGVLASLLLVVVTVSLARAAYTRGWNMDDVGAPAITATGDLVAIPALLVAAILAMRGGVTLTIAVVVSVATLAALVYGWLHPRPEIRRLVRESTAVLSGAAVVSVLAGIVLESRAETFLTIPALLVMFPAFVAMFGSLGGILSSRLTSKLHLGLIEPKVLPPKLAALDFSVTYLFAAFIFVVVAVGTRVAAALLGVESPSLTDLIGVTLIGGMMGTTLLAAVSYAASAATYRFGLDPDNHAIPIVTSVMDFLGMLCLVAALAILGVG